MDILSMKEKRKAELEREFHEKIANLPVSQNTNRLDGGSLSVTDIFNWLKDELKKLDQEFPEQ